ncbi:BREX-1 system adenine-specific DNA-methyltransferase PglX [Schleiferiaceae bacterium]|nr:BREX-1 system adenine-specific DNA-methyltransferase PglX [Schleiferiaceae bacterium]
MALTQGARNKIKSIVQSAKKLLMKEFESQLQQFYGIRPDGTCLLVEELTSREASVIETARLLRQRLHYLEEGIAGSNKAPEAVRQLIREQAFTILNRFAAVRMSEERNIIRESIRKGYNSEGFLVYDQLTGGAKTAEQFTRYTWYIGHVFDELAIDLPAVFDRFSPYALLFPSEKVLLELLEIINDEDLNIHRESGHQPINLWTEDETIGWIYQYYNSREEISEMREASGAPRNSRELAVRNQFFTPRYVVQFLVDNSLGRQWFEMTKGQTSLVDSCQYMVKREQEIFLEKGEDIPEAKIEGANYIEYRQLKDPREILMLDPACGSMHFGLYCFDLFEQIYIEAWDNHPELMMDLRDKYMREDFIKQIPGYILRYNIHGVDIDPRAIQIAGLSLWLRAQKSYDKLGLQPAERPAISKSNLVIAEPMPGDAHLLSEFTKSLPGPIGKLVSVIWDKMQLAGETGLLLKIEEELKKEIEIAKEEYKEYKNTSAQSTLFASPAESKAAQMAAIYGKGQKIKKDFFDTAEEEVLKALKNFAENAEGEDAFQKLLFAEDTARGFAFIELCRKRYDVIVMNPPFGLGLKKNFAWLQNNYPDSYVDILISFVTRMQELSVGFVSSITSRSLLVTPRMEKFRKRLFIKQLDLLLDLGWPVMDDAMVESAAYVLKSNNSTMQKEIIAIDRKGYENKDVGLRTLSNVADNDKKIYVINRDGFFSTPVSKILYNLDKGVLELFQNQKTFKELIGDAKMGMRTFDDFRFVRASWECLNENVGQDKKWRSLSKGGSFGLFYSDLPMMVNFNNNGCELEAINISKNGQVAQVKQASTYYYQPGGTYSHSRAKDFGVRILPEGFVFGTKGPAVLPKKSIKPLFAVSILNARFYNFLMHLQSNARQYDTGIIEKFPVKQLNDETINTIEETALKIIKLLIKVDSHNEKSGWFDRAYFNEDAKQINRHRENLRTEIKQHLALIDHLIDDVYGVDSVELAQTLLVNDIDSDEFESHERDYLAILPNFSETELRISQLSFLIGVSFNRFSYTGKGLNFDNLNEREVFKNMHYENRPIQNYDVQFLENEELERSIREVEKNEIIIERIEDVLGKQLGDYIQATNGFFNTHLKDYSESRRVAPIYWPIATRSNSFVVWLYYPALNDNTLFSVVNELVDPKIKEIAKEVEVLEMKGSAKELNDQKEFLAELEDFKEELLRVAQLPYKPNQDDGVLITAAPLHNLFRHTKWKKSTQDCWKKLEKGEYDWAHLVYSIWPDRVRKKCVKDLSMAIAHGLEEICEIQPKETKKKKPKEIKADTQKKLI